MSARDHAAEMLALRRDGLTLDEIGRRFGVTRERVRQLTPGATGEDARRPRRAREARIEREALDARRDEVLDRFRAGDRLRDIAVALGVRVTPTLEEWLAARVTASDRRERRAATLSLDRGYSDEEIAAALRDAASRLGGPPSTAWAREHMRGPCLATILGRFGNWNAALAAAGLPTRPPARRVYARTGIDGCLRAVRRYIDETGVATVTGYESWARERGELSRSLVSRRFRQAGLLWADAVELALALSV